MERTEFAQEDQYDATVYITSTVYRVNTVTASSSSPAGYTAANSTSTISATHPTIVPSYAAGNTTGEDVGNAIENGAEATGNAVENAANSVDNAI